MTYSLWIYNLSDLLSVGRSVSLPSAYEREKKQPQTCGSNRKLQGPSAAALLPAPAYVSSFC